MKNDFDFFMDLVLNHPVQFGIESGFEDLEDIHNEWIKSFLFSEEDETLLAHRGSYKTTCLSIAIAILLVMFPNQTIIFMRKDDGLIWKLSCRFRSYYSQTSFKLSQKLCGASQSSY